MNEKPKVSLGEVEGVIVLLPTGVLWRAQTGGIACHHPEAEGIFVPLGGAPAQVPHLACWGDDTIAEDADEIQRYIDAAGWPLDVDRTRLDEAEEAWWPVIIRNTGLRDDGTSYQLEDYDSLFAFPGALGWLVTENCD